MKISNRPTVPFKLETVSDLNGKLFRIQMGNCFQFVLLILVVFFAICSCSAFAGPADKEIYINDVRIDVEIARTLRERERGLMYREELAESQGMLFVYHIEDIYPFWMKNMQFSLDMIWISGDNVVVDIKADVPPCRESCDLIMPAGKARYVLEVNSGFCQRHAIKIGDKVDLSRIL